MAGRLYSTARWQRRRLAQLRDEPRCERCLELGRVTEATVADHIERHGNDPVKFWSSPLQSLCERCHNSYKARLERSGAIAGANLDGTPKDPSHWWNQ